MIELTTLGRGTIRRDGEELVAIAAHRQKFALLACVAVEAGVPRERLLAIFWPERDEERARHSLSQAIYAIKRELDEEIIRVEGGSVVAAYEACSVDARELEEAARAERWEDVIELYSGHFLEHFTLPGAPEFEKWQAETQIRLARIARRAFREVVTKRMAAGDPSGALAAATRWAALEPLEDEAQHTLVSLLACSGQRSAALEQFETYRRRLADELEVEPLDETQALVEQIRGGAVPEFRPLGAIERPRAVARVQEPAAPAYEAAAAERAPSPPPHSLIDELRERRIFHVAAVYLAAAWAALEFIDTLAQRGMLADWAFSAFLIIVALGLPFTLLVAWAQEPLSVPVPGAPVPARRFWPRWAEKVRGGQLLGLLTVLVIGLVAGWILLERALPAIRGLDRNRIVVFPLEASPEGNEDTGEDVATVIGYALELTGRLTFIDGWYGLDDIQRAGLEAVSPRGATRVARDEGAAFFVRGRVSLRRDSAVVHVELHDVENDAVAARAQAGALLMTGWTQRTGEEVARQLLAQAFPGEETGIEPGSAQNAALGSTQDTLPAVAKFLRGERAYRRARFGEALEHYRRSVELDSLQALPALKGALAACWHLHCAGAEELVDVALRRSAFLPPHRAHFAYGIKYYLDGQADSAVSRLRQAIAIDSTFWDAWARLAETYTHLLPSESPLDSLAEATFLVVREQSPEFYPVLFHLSQFAIHKGEVARARSLLSEFRDMEPDSSRVNVLEIMLDCVANSPEMVDWREAVRRDPNILYEAAYSLAVAGSQTECARSGWTAILAYDTASDAWGIGRRFQSLVGLQSLLVAEGRYDDLVRLLDAQAEFGYMAGDLFLIDANAGAASEARARARADELRADFAVRGIGPFSSWMLGVWEANHGRVPAVRSLADSLTAYGEREDDRVARMLGMALQARALLAAGDSSRAIEQLQALAPVTTGHFYPWETLASEQLLLAQLLYARGDYTAAARVAANFDAPARPPSDLIYLPASLVLRVRVARQLGDDELEGQCKDRLTRLGRLDLLADLAE